MTYDFRSTLDRIARGETLSREETRQAFNILMSGEATPSQIGGMLMGLRVRGETEDEFAGAIEAMRHHMLGVDAPANAVDIVGTGGDAKGSYNVSTCSAIVTAACGVPIAKHGNRSLSSKSGASDVLTALGVNIELTSGQVEDCIDEAGIGFMFAPAHHPAMRHVGPARVELATRTIFNLLGPMCNPAGVKRQLIGVFSPEWVLVMAKVLNTLGSEKVWVVHGSGFDEVTITGPTHVAALEGGKVRTFDLAPADFGFEVRDESEIAGGDAEENAKALQDVLAGNASAYRDMVLMNCACALVVADMADDVTAGVSLAAEAIDSGKAEATLARLVEASNRGKADG